MRVRARMGAHDPSDDFLNSKLGVVKDGSCSTIFHIFQPSNLDILGNFWANWDVLELRTEIFWVNWDIPEMLIPKTSGKSPTPKGPPRGPKAVATLHCAFPATMDAHDAAMQQRMLGLRVLQGRQRGWTPKMGSGGWGCPWGYTPRPGWLKNRKIPSFEMDDD